MPNCDFCDKFFPTEIGVKAHSSIKHPHESKSRQVVTKVFEEKIISPLDLDELDNINSSNTVINDLRDLLLPKDDSKSKELHHLAITTDVKGLEREIYLNTKIPFCLVTIGVQGAGKSHSLATLIEDCMIDCQPYIKSPVPISTLLFHYDQDVNNICEAVTLCRLRNQAPEAIKPVQGMTVLVSPSFYKQRLEFYKKIQNCKVIPLLFSWKELDASQIRSLMRVDSKEDLPLYMSSILEMLRKYQKANQTPNFQTFKSEIEEMEFTPGQMGPLQLRLGLLESLLTESDQNKDLPASDLVKIFATEKSLVIIDLTDPMLSSSEANGIFQVLLGIFLKMKGPKLVVLDEAHKYLEINSPFSNSITTAVRQMRHHSLRFIISTQSPKTVSSEIMDLSNLVLVHRFSSHDWFTCLRAKHPMNETYFETISNLSVGCGLLYFAKWGSIGVEGHLSFCRVRIRGRLTLDGGQTK